MVSVDSGHQLRRPRLSLSSSLPFCLCLSGIGRYIPPHVAAIFHPAASSASSPARSCRHCALVSRRTRSRRRMRRAVLTETSKRRGFVCATSGTGGKNGAVCLVCGAKSAYQSTSAGGAFTGVTSTPNKSVATQQLLHTDYKATTNPARPLSPARPARGSEPPSHICVPG